MRSVDLTESIRAPNSVRQYWRGRCQLCLHVGRSKAGRRAPIGSSPRRRIRLGLDKVDGIDHGLDDVGHIPAMRELP